MSDKADQTASLLVELKVGMRVRIVFNNLEGILTQIERSGCYVEVTPAHTWHVLREELELVLDPNST